MFGLVHQVGAKAMLRSAEVGAAEKPLETPNREGGAEDIPEAIVPSDLLQIDHTHDDKASLRNFFENVFR